MISFVPRPSQREVLSYTGGRMGVAAVPGSGKTVTLSALAAQLVFSGVLADDQEVLIVTLVNSAVDNFAARVAGFIRQRGLLPHLGYRVRTLHGLAHDIVRERPGLVGLSEDFQIADERESEEILQNAVEAWLRAHPHSADPFLSPELIEKKNAPRDQWAALVLDTVRSFIRQAKDLQLAPDELLRRISPLSGLEETDDVFLYAGEGHPWLLAEMCCAIYADYQHSLNYRGAVDFDDLVRLALQALQADQAYLERLRYRWPFILEDEAQDSSRLQEQLLRMLVGPTGNWVRVGDPNQAIYETFTTASPYFLRDFLEEQGVVRRELPDSGRSTRSIIELANFLIDWTRMEHPVEAVRDALRPPHIRPVPAGDPQPNPQDTPEQVHIIVRRFTPQEEVRAVVDSLCRWLPAHPDSTVAVLTPRNQRGFEVVEELKKRGLEYVELLRSTMSTRQAAEVLGGITRYLADPASPGKLAAAYRAWRHRELEEPERQKLVRDVAQVLQRCRQVEDFLWPRAGSDWLERAEILSPEINEQLVEFRALVRRWHEATLLPVDQLLLTLAQELFNEPPDLALAHKLAALLRRAGESHPQWRLPELSQELMTIARNERRFLGLSTEDTGFDPDQYKGKVVVATVHKAKGLEWDRVYLMSVNNYDFPSAQPGDQFISEKWFVRDGLNLEAEALAQLAALHNWGAYEEGVATQRARLDYVAERLRLLYVGITRARRELIITWNSGRQGDCRPALPFLALRAFWEKRVSSQSEGEEVV